MKKEATFHVASKLLLAESKEPDDVVFKSLPAKPKTEATGSADLKFRSKETAKNAMAFAKRLGLEAKALKPLPKQWPVQVSGDQQKLKKFMSKITKLVGYDFLGYVDKGKKEATSSPALTAGYNETVFYAFWSGKKHIITADSLYAAKVKAIQQLKIPKSKQGLLSVMSKKAYDNQEFRYA